MPGTAFGGSRYMLVGDGLLGIFGKVAKRIGRFIPGVSTGIAAAEAAGAILKRPRGMPSGFPAMSIPSRTSIPGVSGAAIAARRGGIGGVAGALGRIALPVAAGAAIERFGRPGPLVESMTGRPMRRFGRRMNPLNPKALRRATRRLAGFHTFALSTERELRRLAPARKTCAPRKPRCR